MSSILATIGLVAVTASTAGGAPQGQPDSRFRPIPEFAPVRAIVLSDDYFQAAYDENLARAVLAAGAELWVASPTPGQAAAPGKLKALGLPSSDFARIKTVQLDHGNLWMRDYGPLFARKGGKPDAPLTAFDFTYGGLSEASERFPVALAPLLPAELEAARAPLDGGDFLTDGERCVTSRSDGEPLPPLEVFQKLGCRRLITVEDPPHEHVDMWLKLVAPGKALVNELDEQALAVLRKNYGGHVPEEQMRLKERLDVMAKALSEHFEVKRLPMPVTYRGAFRTYANALLVNGTAILPSYDRYGWGYDDYPDASLKKDYERKAASVYESLGLKVRFVNADGLIYNGGALHCVALQVPN